MLTIQSHDTADNSLIKYVLVSSIIFFALIFVFHNFFVIPLSYYVVAFILIFVGTVGKRRVIKFKIQAKRLDAYFGSF